MGLSTLIPGVTLVLASRMPRWPLAAAVVVFAILSLHSWPAVAVGVAAGYLAVVACGPLLRHSFVVALTAEVAGFWLLSNLGNWWQFYPHSAPGLVECLIAGLPYLGQAFLIDGIVAGTLWFGVARRLTPA